MADISSKTTAFKNAVYGSDIKSTLVDLLNSLNSSEFNSGLSKMYRGANLGTGDTFEAASTSAQRSAISSGTFTDLFVGDYWTVNGVVYRIADINYWKRVGDSDFTTNHLVLVPDTSFGNGKMNNSNTTTGAYVGSAMYTDTTTPSVLNSARTQIAADFGNYLLTHKRSLPNAVTNGAQSAGAWVNSNVNLMNELMVYGAYIKCKNNAGTFIATTEKSQLALFRIDSTKINIRTKYWLFDVASSENFVIVDSEGDADTSAADEPCGVRPVFTVGG